MWGIYMCSVMALIISEDLWMVRGDAMPTTFLTTVYVFLWAICPPFHLVHGQCGLITIVPRPETYSWSMYILKFILNLLIYIPSENNF